MAETTSRPIVDKIRAALDEYAHTKGWKGHDYAVSVEVGLYDDIQVRFAAKALEKTAQRDAINKEVWQLLESRLPRTVFSRISLFGGIDLKRFQKLVADRDA